MFVRVGILFPVNIVPDKTTQRRLVIGLLDKAKTTDHERGSGWRKTKRTDGLKRGNTKLQRKGRLKKTYVFLLAQTYLILGPLNG